MVFEPPPIFDSSSLLTNITYSLITSENFNEYYPSLLETIKKADFLALDLEFTGLPYPLNMINMNERYTTCIRHAKEFALLSLGLSCFVSTSTKTPQRNVNGSENAINGSTSSLPFTSKEWEVHTFNILLRREGTYKVSSSSLKFLAASGFDFHKQALHGIDYYSGTLNPEKNTKASTKLLRKLFEEAIFFQEHRPTVLHNGFLDLVMLYHAFYHELPSGLDTFLADMSDLFPGGVYDTKFVAESKHKELQTMLAHLFLHCEKHQRHQPQFSVTFATSLTVAQPLAQMTCTCPEPTTQQGGIPLAHASHTDAFMTGYIFAHQLAKGWVHDSEADYRNRLYLPGKAFPLFLHKSSYVAFSEFHTSQRKASLLGTTDTAPPPQPPLPEPSPVAPPETVHPPSNPSETAELTEAKCLCKPKKKKRKRHHAKTE